MELLYQHMMKLCEGEKTPFYMKDFPLGGKLYRVFSYHAAIPRDFAEPTTLEARGIMFEVRDDGRPIRIASRPMQKFFNKGEHPAFDIPSLEPADVVAIYEKADGSLISSFMHDGEVRVKSKTSLFSDHAKAAQEFLYGDDWLLAAVEQLEREGYTVNMEWVSPDPKFRIVVHYSNPGLIVLNARHRESGLYLPRDILETIFGNLSQGGYLTKKYDHYCLTSYIDTSMMEGYVVVGANGEWIKLKTPWYLERHRAKDFINRPTAFIEMVIKDELDDVMALLDQEDVRRQAEEWAFIVTRLMNETINRVTEFYRENRELSRKDYAIKAQSALTKNEFTLAMMYFAKQEEPDWKAFFLKQVKKIDWGIDLEEKQEAA